MPRAGSPYGGEWRKIRLAVLKRDNYRCQVRLIGCQGRANDVDHEQAICLYGPSFDPAHLRSVCHPCNMKLAGQAVRLKQARSRVTASVGPSRVW